MRYVIRCLGLVGYTHTPDKPAPVGQWLMSYDPEAHDGLGFSEWTAEPTLALLYDTAADATAHYRAIPRRRPVRPDGRPNRPLTAFSIAIEKESSTKVTWRRS